MAARTRKVLHDEKTKEKIRSSQIINRLEDHIFGAVDMKPSQVTAALGLLKKTTPDLTAADNKTEVLHRFVARVPDKAVNSKSWQQQHTPKPKHLQ